MATLAGNNPTMMDWAKQLEPNGGITTDIVEMLSETNEILMDMTWVEANGPTTHRSSIRTGLPAVTWRQFYQGVPASKSTYATVDEPMGMLEARSLVDEDLAKLNGDMAQFRLNEASGFIEAMSQELADTILYGNASAAPTEFNGLMPRLNSLSAASGENVIDALGTGTDNTSILLVGWSTRTVFGVFPKGSSAGIQREDLGKQQVADGAGNRYSALEEKFSLKGGLVVKDWRYVVRAANIDKSDLVDESNAADILKIMTAMVHKIPSLGAVRPVFYVNRTAMTMLDIQAQNKA
ncbi:MAG: hypothetical protein IT337_12500, partial [Thermomicrobiales bacterium]|nr:hypothetical protein [Thermomicrobiales bacterium]